MPSARWEYRDAPGELLGYVLRFDTAAGKEFHPLVYTRPKAGGRPGWRWKSWPKPWPLYGLNRLAARPDAKVVVTEGEKACDASAKLLPAFVAVTSPHGAKSADRADWSPLRGRDITIWPDADNEGLNYANIVADKVAAVGALSVAIVSPPPDCAVKWDAADALAEGWDEAQAMALVSDARPVPNGGGASGRPVRRHRTPQRDVLIGLTDDCECWHDASREAFVTIPVNRHREHSTVRSRQFRIWLAGRFYNETGMALGGQALEDGIRILEARAVNDGSQHERFVRVGQHAGRIYIDLCDTHWRAVEINRDGWRVVFNPPIKFLRMPPMRPLPEPEAGSDRRAAAICQRQRGRIYPRDRLARGGAAAIRPVSHSRCERRTWLRQVAVQPDAALAR